MGNTGSKRNIRNLRLAPTHSTCYPREVKRSCRGRRPGIRKWRGCRRRGRCIIWLLLLLLLLLRPLLLRLLLLLQLLLLLLLLLLQWLLL